MQKKWRFMAVNLKVNAEISERLVISCSDTKIKEIKMALITVVIQLEEFFVIIAASQGICLLSILFISHCLNRSLAKI
jgi:hypothetical protein